MNWTRHSFLTFHGSRHISICTSPAFFKLLQDFTIKSKCPKTCPQKVKRRESRFSSISGLTVVKCQFVDMITEIALPPVIILLRWIWQIWGVHTVPLTALSLKYVLIPQSCSHKVFAMQRLFLTGEAETKQSQAHINTHILSVLDLGELSVCVLWFLSVLLMCRRLFCLSLSLSCSFFVCDFSGKDGWKKLDIDVRPTFHLKAGYPLSKHRTQLMNQTDRLWGVRLFLGSRGVRGAFSYRCYNKTLSLLLSLLLSPVIIFLYLCLIHRHWTGKRVSLVRRCVLLCVQLADWLLWFTVSDSHSWDRCSIQMYVSFMGSCPGLCPYGNRPQKPQAFSFTPSWFHSSLLFVYWVSPLLMGHSEWTSE